jgi:putative transposase
VDWYSVDLPGITALRDEVLPANPHSHSVPVSLAEKHWPDAIPADRPTMLVADGLFTFLSEPVIVSIFRRMTDHFVRAGYSVNRKRVQRLMRIMGLEGLFPGRTTTIPVPEHKVYPYLLRGLTIDRPDQVWCSDITYVPLQRGYLYLVAVMDWHSRHVLAWRLSNTLESTFCLEALDEALARGRPEIFNTDQGSQFTSDAFTSRLIGDRIAISMDGKGRATDNVFIERLWRSVKYEDIYLKDYVNGADVNQGLTQWFDLYTYRRPHQGLGGRTPFEVYHQLPLT